MEEEVAMYDINNIKQCDEILKQGFPEDEKVLQKMPFGFSMLEAYNKKDPNNSNKYLHRNHLIEIVKKMNLLLGGDIRKIIADQAAAKNAFVVGEWVNVWRKIHGKKQMVDEQTQQMWRLEAFLHDVGKSLTYSKHPTRGQYLVTRLKIDDRECLVEMIGQDKFNQIEKVIAFHDRFGVLSTGEASFGILADAVDRGTKDEGASKAIHTLSHIMVLNLIDIGASVPWGLISEKVKVVLGDWENACWNDNSPLRQSNGDRGEFERMLLELAARDEWVIDRISRLLSEAYRRARNEILTERDFDDSHWPEVDKIDFTQPSRQALEALCGIHWDDFKMDFAHVVKMDYLLYLADRIAKVHWAKHGSPDRLAICMVSVIQKLIGQFADLIRRGNKMSRIGIDLSILRDTPEVQRQIAQLLSGDQTDASYGLEWLTHEAGAWPF